MKSGLQFTLVLTFLLPVVLAFAHNDDNSEQHALFKVCRSRDADEIYYTLKTTERGTLDVNEPIHIFWVKHSTDGKKEPLTKVQQRFSYGLKYLFVTPDSADFYFVGFPNKIFKLRRNNTGNYCVFTLVGGEEAELEEIFIQFNGGTFLMPKVSKVELRANNHDANNLVVEIIHP
jgi:hypothetical protein